MSIRALSAAVALAAGFVMVGCAAEQGGGTLAASAVSAAVLPAKAEPGVVYLIRGGANIFSTGLDVIAEKLRAKGVDAQSVGYAGWPQLAVKLDNDYRKSPSNIILIGHSFGANAAVIMTQEMLKHGTPVELMILLDPTESQKIPPNVSRVIYYQSRTATGTGITVTGLFGFRGSIQTIAVKENHLQMDDSVLLQDQTVAAVL